MLLLASGVLCLALCAGASCALVAPHRHPIIAKLPAAPHLGQTLVANGTLSLLPIGGGTGFCNLTYNLYSDGVLITVVGRVGSGAIIFRAGAGLIATAFPSNPFAAFAPSYVSSGLLPIAGGTTATWYVGPSGQLTLVPAYSAALGPVALMVLPSVLTWDLAAS